MSCRGVLRFEVEQQDRKLPCCVILSAIVSGSGKENQNVIGGQVFHIDH